MLPLSGMDRTSASAPLNLLRPQIEVDGTRLNEEEIHWHVRTHSYHSLRHGKLLYLYLNYP